MGFLEKVFGDWNDKEIARIEKIAAKIEALDEAMQALSDDELKAKTTEFKERLASGETLDELLPEAFAVCREASVRTIGLKHFHVQLIGGIVLHEGNIAEMRTGEGKTLVATLPVYLNALTGKGVHVVTVNDYLAKRDCEWMGQIYTFLGLTVGCVIHEVTGDDRRAAYQSDITYGTNNEFGFDYLRDNMAIYKESQQQRELNYAIVDEVDSILVDEARTPLIISGVGNKSTDLYQIADRFVRTLHGRIADVNERVGNMFNEGTDFDKVNAGYDFVVNEKDKSVSLTDEGVAKCEKFFKIENFSDPENMEINHHVQIALKAHNIMKRDVDYMELNGEIVIVDEFTGRYMFGRRYSDGLHQAIEAKEGIQVRAESQTLATITLQNYFRMYNKLAGMTGTAKTEETEFVDIYNMKVIVIPTNKPVARKDEDDIVYTTTRGKIHAIVDDIENTHKTGQPVLVGTISVEKSEILSGYLQRRGIPHNVLNAKQHMREAEIVADAGKLGAVTIATNMAGRGTDIVLGGANGSDEDKAKVKELGGLRIIGTERHEARRIDNQLRGRAGRQGDPGSTVFYISLEDDLMRLFGGDRVQGLMGRIGMEEDIPIAAGILSKTIENAQKKVEGRNYGIRKYVLQYDDVMNRQRSIIYGERNRVLHGENLKEHITNMMKDIAGEIADYVSAPGQYPEEWDYADFERKIKEISPGLKALSVPESQWKTLNRDSLADLILSHMLTQYDAKEAEVGTDRMRELERILLLKIVDTKWMDHIDAMDQLKTGVGLRSLGGVDPAQAYTSEGMDMFEEMIKAICDDIVKFIFAITITTNAERQQVITIGASRKDEAGSAYDEGRAAEKKKAGQSIAQFQQRQKGTTNAPKEKPKPVRVEKKPGRNDPCPCGSGKKYKNCCGRNE